MNPALLSRPVAAWIAAGALLAALPAAAQPGQPLIREGVTEKISEHIYEIPDGNVSLVPNVGIIVGARATFVIDTGLGARNAQTILKEVAKVSKHTELYLGTTHVHPEHDLGAHAFPPETKMLRSTDQQKEIAEGGMQMASNFSRMSPLHADLLKDAQFRKADISFEKEHVIDLGGGVRVRAIAMGTNHTRGDTAFFVEPDGVLFSGDVVMKLRPSFANPTPSINRWLTSLDTFEKLAPKRIVPSHGPVGDLSYVTDYREYFKTIQTRAAALKKEGKTLDQTVTTVADELREKYPNDRGRITGAVRAAYNEAP